MTKLARILISETKKYLQGGHINTETSILAPQTGEANHTTTVNILDCHAPRLFWVSWMNEMVQVGEYPSKLVPRCNRPNPSPRQAKPIPPPTLGWRVIRSRQSIPRVGLACCTTLLNIIFGNCKNYHKPKFQFLSIYYLSKPNQINKGGSFEDQICL